MEESDFRQAFLCLPEVFVYFLLSFSSPPTCPNAAQSNDKWNAIAIDGFNGR